MPRVKKLEKEPLARRAVDAIRDAIFGGRLLPGARLVEEQLAADLGVSRNVVREAFWQLEAQGLVQSDNYRGKSVAALDDGDVAELIPLRIIFECMAAMRAAANITDQAKITLAAQAAMFRFPIHDCFSYAVQDIELHQAIWQIAGSAQLSMILDRITGPLVALQSKLYIPLLNVIVRKENEEREGSHVHVVSAICRGDANAASQSMRSHILSFWHRWESREDIDAEVRQDAQQAVSDAVELTEILAEVLATVAAKP
jgi:DNA-binding GntR family transcriptional regulator